MRYLSDLWFRLRAALFPSKMETELDGEVVFHLAMEAEKLVAQGMKPAQAAREARRRFGALGRERQVVRDAWGIGWVSDFRADCRHAVRQFWRQPLFSALGVGTLGLGIGATVALFSVVQGLLLRPLPVTDQDRLRVFWSDYDWRGVEFDFAKERVNTFSGLAAFSSNLVTLRRDASTIAVPTTVASAELLDVLGVSPAMGRGFVRGDDRPGAESVVLVSWGLWQQEFGGDPGVVGQRVVMDGQPTTVIGVMPKGFYFPSPEYRAWKPLRLDPASSEYQGNGWLVLIGRVAPPVAEPAVAGDIAALATALGERFKYPAAWDKTKGAKVTPLRQYLLGDVKPALLLLLGAVALLLLMACANVAALVLARTTDRTSEMVLRTALGAGRSRLARQVTTESLVLSTAAALIGAALAAGLFEALVASLPLREGFGSAIALDWATLASALGLALIVGLAVALAPVRSLLAGRLTGVSGVRGRVGTAVGPARTHAYLVGTEVALAVLLASGAGLFIRTVSRLYAVDPGFDPRGVEAVDLIAPTSEIDSAGRAQFYREVVSGAAAIPGIAAAGFTARLPIRDGGWQGTVEIEGQPDLVGPNAPNSLYRVVTPGYFAAMGLSVRRGRGFEPTDRAGAVPVALVSEAFAARAWSGLDPIGRRVGLFDGQWVTVVGVVEEVRMLRMTGENPLVLYVHLEQTSPPDGAVLVVKATSGRPDDLVAPLRALVSRVNPQVAVSRTTNMETVVANSLAEPLRLRFLLSLFAGLALVLGVVGIYGVVSYSVVRRRSEFGIRIALGAAPTRVVAEVVRAGLVPVGLGVGVGLAAALALSRVVGGFLAGGSGADPVSLGAAAAILLLAGIVAALIPAWRAGRTSPVGALRGD